MRPAVCHLGGKDYAKIQERSSVGTVQSQSQLHHPFSGRFTGELQKAANETNIIRLAALLELSQRTSSAHVDVFKDDLKCTMLPYTLATELFRIMNVAEARPVRDEFV